MPSPQTPSASSLEVPIDFTAIERAHDRLRGLVHRTPVLSSRTIDDMSGARVFFKCENLQRVGAFKIRGATNALLELEPSERAAGVIAHSSGNHAQALALAGREQGVKVTIVMPRNAPPVKRAATVGYGARVIECEPTLAAREATTSQCIEREGLCLIHPYDDWRVIAGQGTAAWELFEDQPELDVVITPVGGGGLLAGTALATRRFGTRVLVMGAEPAGADDAARSLAADRIIPVEDPRTIADGLRTSLGQRPFAIIRRHVTAIHTVDDSRIIAATALLMERMKIVVEPSGAIGAAVVLSRLPALEGLRIGVILSGGNLDLSRLWS